MPPRHVYGKRSRAIYDPLSAFASPQRTPTALVDDGEKPNPLRIKEPKMVAQNGEEETAGTLRRKALGEINANEAVKPVNPLKGLTKNKRPHRRKVVVDYGEEEQKAEAANTVNKSPPIEVSQPHSELRGKRESEVPRTPTDDAIKDIPLPYDGHDDDGDHTATHSLVKRVAMEPNQEQTPEMIATGTPSISISPPTPPELDEYSEHCASLLQLSSHQMNDFTEWVNVLSSHFHITKIAEASFGEVYRLSLLERISGFSSNDESVFKVIALKPPDCKLPTDKRKLSAVKKKIEGMSAVVDVANEVRLLQRMSDVPGFTNFREVRIVKGRPPRQFAKAFKDFNVAQKAKKKELSVFPDPAKKASYADDQLWAVIEMQDAGTDLELMVENGDCTSIWFVWDSFWQVALSLAKGEEVAEFEHRDLHLGNICVRQPSGKSDKDSSIDTRRKLNFTGLETTIIDYTISRAMMQDSSIAHKDLAADSAIFEGDSTGEYQYDIYRYMRSALFLDNPLEDFPAALPSAAKNRSWEQYHAVTNLIWLHFILHKLLEQVGWPSATKPPPRKDQNAHAVWKRANDLEHVLTRVGYILDPGRIFENEIRSARDLVLHAVNEAWLDQNDVVGEGKWDEEDIENALAAQFDELGLEAITLDGGGDQHAKSDGSKAHTKEGKVRV